ncbi:MAG TPA: thioesterase family protein [Acidimicrobiia bacterium]
MAADAYFTTRDGVWFVPSDFARGPWDAESCHAGPPTALIVRALERLVSHQALARLTVELRRPIPMSGFAIEAEVRRTGRSATFTAARLTDDDRVLVEASATHLRALEHLDVATAPFDLPDFSSAVPGPFPITDTRHGLQAFSSSIEVRYDPSQSQGSGGPTTVWMRTIPILADEEPSPIQRLCPLADSGNGISYNNYLDKILFMNPDLTLAVHRQPASEWVGSRVRSHWHTDGTGLADAELFDTIGPVGRATQSLLLMPAP